MTKVAGQGWKVQEILSGQRVGQECTGNSLQGTRNNPCGDPLVWESDLCSQFPSGGQESLPFPQSIQSVCLLSEVQLSLDPSAPSPGGRATLEAHQGTRLLVPNKPSATPTHIYVPVDCQEASQTSTTTGSACHTR